MAKSKGKKKVEKPSKKQSPKEFIQGDLDDVLKADFLPSKKKKS